MWKGSCSSTDACAAFTTTFTPVAACCAGGASSELGWRSFQTSLGGGGLPSAGAAVTAKVRSLSSTVQAAEAIRRGRSAAAHRSILQILYKQHILLRGTPCCRFSMMCGTLVGHAASHIPANGGRDRESLRTSHSGVRPRLALQAASARRHLTQVRGGGSVPMVATHPMATYLQAGAVQMAALVAGFHVGSSSVEAAQRLFSVGFRCQAAIEQAGAPSSPRVWNRHPKHEP